MTRLHRRSVVAVMPCHAKPPARDLLDAVSAAVDQVVLVDDGMPSVSAALLCDLARGTRCTEIVTLLGHAGKGHALAAGIRLARDDLGADAVLTVDADGQHPAVAIPRFLSAAEGADLVIGDRLGDPGRMPPLRRVANRLCSALVALRLGRPVPDSQCGMRLLRRRALCEVAFPGGGMESETRHLVRCARAGLTVRWVPIPAIYAGERSAFRPVRDSVAVVAAAVAGS